MNTLVMVLDTAQRELIHLRRDRRLLLLLLLAPPALTVLFGYAFESNAITGIPLAVFDEDDSPASREMIAGWSQITPPGARDPLFSLSVYRGSREQAESALDGEFWGAVHIPVGFGRRLSGKPDDSSVNIRTTGPVDTHASGRAVMTLFVDGSDTISGPQIIMALTESTSRLNRTAAEELVAQLRREGSAAHLLAEPVASTLIGPVELSAGRPLFNPDLVFLGYMLPGVMGMILMLVTVTPLAASIAGERETGTLEQIAVSPASGWALLLGKALPYALPAAFDVACVALVTRVWFGLAPNGGTAELVALAAATAIFVPAALAIGVLIGTVSHTRMQAVQLSLFYLMPALMLTGAYAPLESIPEPVRPVSNFFPLTFFCRAFRDAWFRGRDLTETADDLAGLAGFTVVGLVIAGRAFSLRRE